MRKATLIIFFMTILCFYHTASRGDALTEGKRRAKNEDKAILVYFFSKYCPYCKQMERDVLKDKKIISLLNKDVVYTTIDVDKRTDTANTYGVWGFPTTLLLESTGKRIAQIPGYIGKDDFKMILSYLKGKHYKTMGLGEFLEAANAGRKTQQPRYRSRAIYTMPDNHTRVSRGRLDRQIAG